ncbi:MAG: PAS domain S-box protein, partial [Chromatiales bacterium]
RVCCERPTPTADYQPSFHSPWLAATVEKLFATITTLLREYSGLQEMRQQHENLQKNIDRLKALASLFQETSLATLVLDDQYRIKAVNPAFEKVTGFSAEYSIGRRADFLKSNNNDETILNAAWKNLLDQACRDAQDAKRDVQVPLLPSLIT